MWSWGILKAVLGVISFVVSAFVSGILLYGKGEVCVRERSSGVRVGVVVVEDRSESDPSYDAIAHEVYGRLSRVELWSVFASFMVFSHSRARKDSRLRLLSVYWAEEFYSPPRIWSGFRSVFLVFAFEVGGGRQSRREES